MEFDLHFSSAPTFLLRPRGRGVSFCSKAECHHNFYIKYVQQAPAVSDLQLGVATAGTFSR